MQRVIFFILAIPFAMLSASAVDHAAADALYAGAILKDGDIDEALATLAVTAASMDEPPRRRAAAHLMRGELFWRHGQRQSSLDEVEQAIRIHPSFEGYLRKAQLLDAAGDAAQARAWYEKALPLVPETGEGTEVRLRLSLMSASNGEPRPLVELANAQEQRFRNRAAEALAVLGHHKEALALFKVISRTSPEQFQEHLRVAEWAIRAKDVKRAQAHAWEAAGSSSVVPDRRYALALLVEAHRMDDSLRALIDRLARQPSLLPEARDVWIDLLREAGRYDEAIALARGQNDSSVDVEAHRRLLRLYREAGRHEAIVAEYRRLIAAEPERIDWPRGLAEYYSGISDARAAEQVWRDFLTKHIASPSLILSGANAAAQMGFDTLAVEALEALIARNCASTRLKGDRC